MPRLSRGAEVAPGVVLNGDRQLEISIDVLFDRVDHRAAPLEREVEDVPAAAPRCQLHPTAPPQLDTLNDHGIGAGALQLLPVARAAHRPSRTTLTSRIAP